MDQTNLSKKQFGEMVEKASPNSSLIMNCIKAFVSGGLICGLAQVYFNALSEMGFTKDEAQMITVVTLIFIAAVLTGLGFYNKIAKHAGAGTIVPITGFSNSVVSPAIEFKKEGLVFGVGAKMFIVAGPVIVYGLAASAVVGLVYYFIK